jgi:hypothetical protein
MKDYYCLSNYSQLEKTQALKFIAEAIKGYVDESAFFKAKDIFDKLEHVEFSGDDTFEIEFTITTLGNDFIAALGAAKRHLT